MNAFWAQRTPGERRTLLIGGTLAAVLLLVTLVWLPLERSRSRMATEIPQLASALATMERQAGEVARVRSMPPLANATTGAVADLSTSIGRALPTAQVTMIDAKRIRLAAADVPYGTLLETIAASQSSLGLRVDTARIEALPAAGRVRAELVLSRP